MVVLNARCWEARASNNMKLEQNFRKSKEKRLLDDLYQIIIAILYVNSSSFIFYPDLADLVFEALN